MGAYNIFRVVVMLVLLAIPHMAPALDTVGCAAKSVWRKSVVETIVADWYENESDPEDLLALLSAEQGIAACNLGRSRTTRMHTSTIPRDLQPGQLGSLLLANEMSWARLLPEPEEGLSGRAFIVVVPPLRAEDY